MRTNDTQHNSSSEALHSLSEVNTQQNVSV